MLPPAIYAAATGTLPHVLPDSSAATTRPRRRASGSLAALQRLLDRAGSLTGPGPGFGDLRREAVRVTRVLHVQGQLPAHLVVEPHDPYPVVVRTLAHAATVPAAGNEGDLTWESSSMVVG